MPNTLATAVWPMAADQIVVMNSPADVAPRMIGRGAPAAAAGTTPTSVRPSATAPMMKHGRPSAAGSAAGAAAATLATGGRTCTDSSGFTSSAAIGAPSKKRPDTRDGREPLHLVTSPAI